MPPTTQGGTLKKWWVIQRPSGSRAGIPATQVVSGGNKPSGSIAGPFTTLQAAQNWIKNNLNKGISLPNPGKIVQGWLGGIGGSIGSGIEAGFIQSVKDIWDVIIGPLEVLAGFALAILVLIIYFKDDIVSGGLFLAKIMSAGVA